MVPSAVDIDIHSLEEIFDEEILDTEAVEVRLDLQQPEVLAWIFGQENDAYEAEEERRIAALLAGVSVSDIPESPPLYSTSNGGIVTVDVTSGVPVWFSNIPRCLRYAQIGDPIPDRWNLTALNAAAQNQPVRDRTPLYC